MTGNLAYSVVNLFISLSFSPFHPQMTGNLAYSVVNLLTSVLLPLPASDDRLPSVLCGELVHFSVLLPLPASDDRQPTGLCGEFVDLFCPSPPSASVVSDPHKQAIPNLVTDKFSIRSVHFSSFLGVICFIDGHCHKRQD